MQQLLAESVRREQIAATCSLWTPDGKPDVNKVQQELDEPGSIVTEEFLEALHQKNLKDEGFVYVEERSQRRRSYGMSCRLAKPTCGTCKPKSNASANTGRDCWHNWAASNRTAGSQGLQPLAPRLAWSNGRVQP